MYSSGLSGKRPLYQTLNEDPQYQSLKYSSPMSVPLCSMVDVGMKARFYISMMLGRDDTLGAPERFKWPLISREIKVKNCLTEDNGRHLCSSGPPISDSACHDCIILNIARSRACARVSRPRRGCLFLACRRNIRYYVLALFRGQ